MGDHLGADLISDLPVSIIESILASVPIRDAVRTSILSSKWRYKWNGITSIVVDEKCVPPSNDRTANEKKLLKFVNQLLFLHQGPIHKFKLTSSYLQSSPKIDQFLLFLSRNGLQELVLELGEGFELFRIPSCLFNCEKLIRLDLVRCELEPPVGFKGFMCLKALSLHQVLISSDAIDSLISSCPLLESLSLSYSDSVALTIHAPKLRTLFLEGEFKDVILEDTPLLVDISVALYMSDDAADHFENNSNCNFTSFLGGVPNLERLAGHVYFTKVTVLFFMFVELVQVHFAWSYIHGREF